MSGSHTFADLGHSSACQQAACGASTMPGCIGTCLHQHTSTSKHLCLCLAWLSTVPQHAACLASWLRYCCCLQDELAAAHGSIGALSADKAQLEQQVAGLKQQLQEQQAAARQAAKAAADSETKLQVGTCCLASLNAAWPRYTCSELIILMVGVTLHACSSVPASALQPRVA